MDRSSDNPSPPVDTAPASRPQGFKERRKRPTPMFSKYSFLGGRRSEIPGGLKEGAYVDRYDLRLVMLILAFFALTMFDAISTVYFIDHVKGTEKNPLAGWMLEQGRVFFVFAKGVPTALMLLFVMVHKNFRYGRLALIIGFSFYLALALYHVLLQWHAYLMVLSKPLV